MDGLDIKFRLDRGILKPARLLSGDRLLAPASFARDGILVYREPNGGIRRELRLPETNMDGKTLSSYACSTLTIEHPPELITGRNRQHYGAGVSDRQVVYDDGYITGIVLVNRSDAIEAVQKKTKAEISAGYFCDTKKEPGTWRGERYDAIQELVDVNHIALTERGRAGPKVKIHVDSPSGDDSYLLYLYQDDDDSHSQDGTQPIYFDQKVRSQQSQPQSKEDSRMSGEVMRKVVHIDNMQFDDIEQLANYVTEHYIKPGMLNQDAVLWYEDAIQEMVDVLNENSILLEALHEVHKDTQDSLEATTYLLDAAEVELEDFGLVPTADGDYVQVDEGDEDNRNHDSVSDCIKAWKEADALIPGISDSPKYDSDLSPMQIKKLVLDSLYPGTDIDSSNIEGFYQAVTSGRLDSRYSQSRSDSGRLHTDSQYDAINAARNAHREDGRRAKGSSAASDKMAEKAASNYSAPLALSNS